MMLYYLTMLLYVLPTTQTVSTKDSIVIQISPGHMGQIVADWTPGAIPMIAPGLTGFHGPTKAGCEKWGNEVRQTMAKDMGIKDYRQIKYSCELRQVVY